MADLTNHGLPNGQRLLKTWGMRTIGLIGGMSWHSTMTYYRLLNEAVARERGGHSSARIVLQSLDFSEIRECQVNGDWDGAGRLLSAAARSCQDGGADVVAICTNLMHKVAPAVEASLTVPLLHIADAVAIEADCGVRRSVAVFCDRSMAVGAM